MTSEADDVVAISGLQHLIFCERQAALIHVERAWEEDGSTAAGRLLHERADLPGVVDRAGVRVARSVALRCDRLAIVGRADVVEYHRDPSIRGGWRPFPVEYKRGRRKNALADRVQVCAQALCLEEMHGVEVPQGALYYGASHRRVDVRLDRELRLRTETAARRLHDFMSRKEVPPPEPGPKCETCSLVSICLPYAVADRERGRRYLARIVADVKT